jgi:enoyl-CoA hydratase/carnithine racemase
VCADEKLSQASEALIETLVRRNSATAMGMAKELLGKMAGMNMSDAMDFATNMNAAAGMTAEGKRGMHDYLNNQQPEW